MSFDGLASVQARIAEIQQVVTPNAKARSEATKSASFDQFLSQAISADDNNELSGMRNATLVDGIPADLKKYGNGKIPAQALQSIGVGSHKLWAPAAQAFKQMKNDAARQGIQIGVTDSYRSYDQQVEVANRKGLYSQGGLAAKPGTSQHGWGMSLDLDLDTKAQEWIRQNGARYGFVENTPREPWHWTFGAK